VPSRSQSRCIFHTELDAAASCDGRHRSLCMRDAHHARSAARHKFALIEAIVHRAIDGEHSPEVRVKRLGLVAVASTVTR
jgi:hypothetical protein